MNTCLVAALLLSIAFAEPAVSLPARHAETYRNHEFGAGMTFPAVEKVCVALSGDHPHGFYAWYGASCRRETPLSHVGVIALYASFNSTYETSPWEELPAPCRAADTRGKIVSTPLRDLVFPGHKSVQCVVNGSDGALTISVVTMAGHWPDSEDSGQEFRSPWMIYTASLVTYPERLPQDLPRFRAFLHSVTIRPPR